MSELREKMKMDMELKGYSPKYHKKLYTVTLVTLLNFTTNHQSF